MKKNDQIYGLRAILEALHADEPFNKIFLQQGLQNALYSELKNLAMAKGVSLSFVPKQRLDRLTKNNHQGAVGQISPVAFVPFEMLMENFQAKKNLLLLLLDGVSDVRNFGAIIRTAECTGVDAIIVPKSGSAPINNDTLKTSAGAAFNIPIAKVDHLKDAVFYLQASDIQVLAATEKASKEIYDCNLSKSTAIIMGAEDKGISPSLLKMVDERAKLPIMGTIDSLNVSVACGAILYEAVRQRNS